jgi:hypothetical protein
MEENHMEKKYSIFLGTMLLIVSGFLLNAMEDVAPGFTQDDQISLYVHNRALQKLLNDSFGQNVSKRQSKEERIAIASILNGILDGISQQFLKVRLPGQRRSVAELADFIADRYWLNRDNGYYEVGDIEDYTPLRK